MKKQSILDYIHIQRIKYQHTKQLIEKKTKLNWQHIKFIFWNSDILKIALPTHYQELNHLGSDRALRIYHLSKLEQDIPQIGVGCGTGFTIEIIQHGKLMESLILPGFEITIKPACFSKLINFL